MKNIIILASGSGTNAQRIAEHFENNKGVCIQAIFSNRTDAYVLQRAEKLGIPAYSFSRDDIYSNGSLLKKFEEFSPDLIVLAGFLWLIPSEIIQKWPIINIHPALLPKYGGKGMFGHHVHEAVIRNGEKESGITIHLVNEKYDDGQRLFQAKCPVFQDDVADTLAERIHRLEHEHFPKVIETFLETL